ncbi:MAG: lipopolysaccharide biosynthesis protein [Bacteroidales bacterium]|nr:lipopolysaccharide biosynthesis protein [Bacteroidales bacterium]
MPADDMKSKAASGLAWTSFEKVGQEVIQFVIGIIIARILAPEDFGVVGMTAIFLALANTIVDSGFGSALIQKKDRTEADYSTCFYFNILVGLAIYGILWIAAPWIADFYRTPILTDVVRVLGIAFIINSLSISQTARMTAEMQFRQMSVITIVAQLVTGLVGLVLAMTGWGVWALVFQQIASGAVRLIGMEIALKWVPSLQFSRQSFRHLFGFGSKILCSSIINTVYNNLYTLVIGRAFLPSDVGYYTRANQTAALPTSSLTQVVMKVAYPMMAQVQDDVERLRNAYTKFLRAQLFVIFPVLLGIAALAEPLFLVLLGEKWLPAVPLLQVLCLGMLFDPLTVINLNILYVKGRTDLVLRLELIKKPIAFLILFLSLNFGLMWLCAGRALYCLIAYAFNCYYTGRFIGMGFWRQIVIILPVLVRGVVMGAVCYGLCLVISNPLAQVIVGALAGGAVYLGMAYAAHDDTMADGMTLVKTRFLRK